ncbi:TetR/AcrR family transcriptional regulator [Nocardia rhamnosiphila]|uniref:TetR/AcrR family transcriptional regulator n=1 Tax=Nocardia rhamnosiphila TaxID=426716 RepID=UPI0033F0FDD7
MPPTNRRPTDDELLDAARVVFAAHGYRTASMDAIAEQANSTKPTLYAHFGSKQELFRRLFEREAAAMSAAMLPVYATMPGREMAEMVSIAFGTGAGYVRANPESSRVVNAVLSGDGPDPAMGHRVLDALIESIANVIDDTIRRDGHEPGPVGRLIASMTWGAAMEANRVADSIDLPEADFVDWLTAFTHGGLEATRARIRSGALPLRPAPGQSTTPR